MNSNTAVAPKIDQSILEDGAQAIASLPAAVSGILEGDYEVAGKNLAGIYYESHVAWQSAYGAALLSATPKPDASASWQERKAHREAVAGEMARYYVEDYLK